MRRLILPILAVLLVSCGVIMPIDPNHQLVGPALGGPFSTIECPNDKAPATAADMRRIAAAALANDADLQEQLDDFFDNTANFAHGINASNDMANGDAIAAFGNGTGRGITAVGGNADGPGGFFTGGGPNGVGLEAHGIGAGVGAVIQGGPTGRGALVSAGGGNTVGLEVFSTGTAAAAKFNNGGIHLNGTQPTISDNPGTNIAHSTNIQKAWATIDTDGSGGATVLDGMNINTGALSITSTYIEITWTRIFANANYAVQVTCSGNNLQHYVGAIDYSGQTLAKTRVYFRDVIPSPSVLVNPTAAAFRFTVAANGRH